MRRKRRGQRQVGSGNRHQCGRSQRRRRLGRILGHPRTAPVLAISRAGHSSPLAHLQVIEIAQSEFCQTGHLQGAGQLRGWVNSYVKEGVKGLLDKPIAAKFVSIPMTFTKKELALKRSYDA
jgi:hypothetical protein